MSNIEIIDDSIWIELGGETAFLSTVLNEKVDWVEKYMCEDNAKEIYDIAVCLENLAWELRRSYEKWKQLDFEKAKVSE